MLNLLPHKFQLIAGCILIIPFVLEIILIPTELVAPRIFRNTIYALAVILYFLSKDEILDEYVDMLKIKAISIVFMASAVLGFIFNELTIIVEMIPIFQLVLYFILIYLFKAFYLKAKTNIKQLNLLPHRYKKIGVGLLVFTIIGQLILSVFRSYHCPPEWESAFDKYSTYFFGGPFESLCIAIGILLYFLSKDKIQDEYIDMLKLRSMSIVFILSAVVGLLFYKVSTPLIIISLVQVVTYIGLLKFFKTFSI